MGATSLHLLMYPWFALGHFTSYLHLSNKLAQKGHRISFLIPTKTQSKLQTLNLYPDLITFVPISLPHVDGLPLGAETTSDVPVHLQPLIMTAMDRSESHIELLLRELQPDIVFFDFAHWIPKLVRSLGIRSILYAIVTPLTVFCSSTAYVDNMQQPGSGFPVLSSSSIKLHVHEERALAALKTQNFGSDVLLADRLITSVSQCDALGFRTCREIEEPYIDNLESHFGKPVFLAGPVIPKSATSTGLEEKWIEWLGRFEAGSVIYCAFGSECFLNKDQFQELVLGLELSGWPFLAALKPPCGADSIEEAFPEGFEDRVQGRGMVHGGWFFNARMMSNILKVGVEVEKGEEDGLFTKESVCKAVKIVMEVDSEVGREVRANHAKLRELLSIEDLESSYIDGFCQNLKNLVG
ncbi:hypothetical protein ACB098_06G118500 [Castanea mollissima]